MTDGRSARGAVSRTLILDACRRWMAVGNFRPSMEVCCAGAGRAVRTGFEYFISVEGLHLAALKDETVRATIAQQVLLGTDYPASDFMMTRIARAVVLGRV